MVLHFPIVSMAQNATRLSDFTAKMLDNESLLSTFQCTKMISKMMI